MLEQALVIILSIILSISVVLNVLEAHGFLPDWVAERLNRAHVKRTLQTLAQLGFDIEQVKRSNLAASIPEHYGSGDLEVQLQQRLRSATIKIPVEIGDTDRVPSPKYIDAMGASTASSEARVF